MWSVIDKRKPHTPTGVTVVVLKSVQSGQQFCHDSNLKDGVGWSTYSNWNTLASWRVKSPIMQNGPFQRSTVSFYLSYHNSVRASFCQQAAACDATTHTSSTWGTKKNPARAMTPLTKQVAEPAVSQFRGSPSLRPRWNIKVHLSGESPFFFLQG